MKMNWGIFWGALLVLIGLSLIIKFVFNVDFPLVKIVVAFAFIYLGIKILVGGQCRFFAMHKDETAIIFGETNFDSIEKEKEYSVVFGKGTFDLRNIKVDTGQVYKVQLNTVFGASELLIDKEQPVKIRSNAAFAGVELPNHNTTAFGTAFYTSDTVDTANGGYIEVETNTVFGATKVR
jgi:hypothetical protein